MNQNLNESNWTAFNSSNIPVWTIGIVVSYYKVTIIWYFLNFPFLGLCCHHLQNCKQPDSESLGSHLTKKHYEQLCLRGGRVSVIGPWTIVTLRWVWIFSPCKIPIPYDASYVYDACNVLVKSYSKSVVVTTHGIVLVKSAPDIIMHLNMHAFQLRLFVVTQVFSRTANLKYTMASHAFSKWDKVWGHRPFGWSYWKMGTVSMYFNVQGE